MQLGKNVYMTVSNIVVTCEIPGMLTPNDDMKCDASNT